jgi:hypothetical protein
MDPAPLEFWYVLRFGTAEDLYALHLHVLDLSPQALDRILSRFILGFGLLRAKLFKLRLHLDEHRVIIVVHHRCSLLGAAFLFGTGRKAGRSSASVQCIPTKIQNIGSSMQLAISDSPSGSSGPPVVFVGSARDCRGYEPNSDFTHPKTRPPRDRLVHSRRRSGGGRLG